MSALDSSDQQIMLQIAEIASRRQKVKEKCLSIERSDFKCTIRGVERLRTYKRELELIEAELEAAVKQWDDSTNSLIHSAQ